MYNILVMHLRLLIGYLFFQIAANCQFNDDFSDGDFSKDPKWIGDTSLFMVNHSEELQLLDTGYAKTAYLSTNCAVVYDAFWKFSVRLNFNPSSSNFCKIYLGSDQVELNSPLRGHYILVGGSKDNVSLYRQNGTNHECLIEGRSGLLNHGNNEIQVIVERKRDGEWILATDTSKANQFSEEGRTNDLVYFNVSYFGIYCEYTKTRSDKFYFDNIEVMGETSIPDSIPPFVQLAQIHDKSGAIITYNEVLHKSSNSINYYHVIGGNSIEHVQRLNEFAVKVFFENKLISGDSVCISITGIQDTSGNVIVDTSLDFVYFELINAKKNDLVISELLPDPEPSRGLPSCEFIEIYNRTEYYINLDQVIFMDAQTSSPLSGEVSPHSFVLVCPKDQCSSFSRTINCIELDKFPSLNNSEDHLSLKDKANNVLFELHYSNNQFLSSAGKEGGVSLELSDYTLNCFGWYNYHESTHPLGGTPGLRNSQRSREDFTGGIKKIEVLESGILVETYAPLDSNLKELAPILCEEAIFDSTLLFETEFTTFISFQRKPFRNIPYNCSIHLPYCHTELLTEYEFTFVLPEREPQFGELVINELYFNPPSNGSDYIEIYNSSDKYLSLEKLYLTNNKDTTELKGTIGPKNFVVLTEDSIFVLERFLANWNINFLPTSKLIALPNDSGSAFLVTKDNALIDIIKYRKEFHNIFLTDEEDVALERIHPSANGTKSSSWSSASAKCNYGTPGRINSQFHSSNVQTFLFPHSISPNGDGINDELHVQLSFAHSGSICNIGIYDLHGYCHYILERNTIMPKQSMIKWAGINSNEQFVPSGPYFVFLECYSPTGIKYSDRLPFYVN